MNILEHIEPKIFNKIFEQNFPKMTIVQKCTMVGIDYCGGMGHLLTYTKLVMEMIILSIAME